MERTIENAADRILDNIFGGIGLQVNIIFGIFMLVLGIFICVLFKNKMSKTMKIIGFIFIGLGWLVTLFLRTMRKCKRSKSRLK